MPAQITVVRVAGEEPLTDEQVFQILERQMRMRSCRLEISVKASEEQIDKAMLILMKRLGEHEIKAMTRKKMLQ